MTETIEPPPLYDERRLPPGWSMGFDVESGRPFYRDDLSSPPHRVIWVHPFDDPQFPRSRIPEEDDTVPEYQPRDSLSPSPGPSAYRATSSSPPPASARGSPTITQVRSFLGNFKDKMIGTKEEREAAYQERQARAREEERIYIDRRNAAIARRDAELEEMRAHMIRLPGAVGGMMSGSFIYGEPIRFKLPDSDRQQQS